MVKIESEDLKEYLRDIYQEEGQNVSLYKLMGHIEELEEEELGRFEVDLERDVEGLNFNFNIGGTVYNYLVPQEYIEHTILNLPGGDHIIKEVFPQMFKDVVVQLFCKRENGFNTWDMYEKINEWFEQSLSVLTVPEEG